MPLGEIVPNRRFHLVNQLPIELVPRLHQQEQHDALVIVLWPPLPNAQRVRDSVDKVFLDDRVDLSRPEPYSRGIQHTVRPAEEVDITSHRVDAAEVAVRPDVVEAREVRGVEFRTGACDGRLVAPEAARYIGEGRGRYQFTGGSVLDWFSRSVGQESIVDGDRDS